MKYGPEFKTTSGRKKFFNFYKTHRSRALLGFLKDIKKNKKNAKKLENYLSKKKVLNCLIVGCSHWANPRDTRSFLRSFNKEMKINVTVVDALPDALTESVKNKIDCLPLVTLAQRTPFLDNLFDIAVCDCLLTCCSFDQHEPIIKEIGRVLKKNSTLLLGIVCSEKKNETFVMSERPITNYCRPLTDYKKLFYKYGFKFFPDHSVETRLPGKWSNMRIENTIVSKIH